MASAAAFMAVASTTLQAGGALFEGQQQARAQKQAARTSEWNARLAEQQGEDQARLVRRQGRYEQGQRAAQFAASGVAMEGSALDIMARSAFDIEMDALQTEYDADVQATGLRMQAGQQRVAARASRTGAVLGAGAAGTQLLANNPQWFD